MIRLPITCEKIVNKTDTTSRRTAVLETCGQLPEFRIVVVDDDRSMRFLMSRLLQNLGQSVTVAENGDKAIEAVIRKQPHVVFIDLQMHGMSGFDVARQLRSRFKLNNVVLIALSGNADAASRKLATESGFDQYLVKPTSLAELTETLLGIAIQSIC